MPRALVLGATGHIGAHAARAFLARGYSVLATYRNPRYRFLLDDLARDAGRSAIEAVQLDLDEPAALARLADRCDVVAHCGGYYPRWTDRREPALRRAVRQVDGVFEALKTGRPGRVVYVSSAATIRSRTVRPATEKDREPWPPAEPSDWRPLYGTAKAAMEAAVLRHAEAGVPVVIVNPSICIGEYDAHAFSGKLLLLFAQGRIPVYVEHSINVIYTGDVGEGIASAAERGRLGERYLLSHRNMTVRDFAGLAARAAGVAPPRWALPYPVGWAAAAMTDLLALATGREPLLSVRALRLSQRTHHWLDSHKAQQELGLPQTPIETAVDRALGWFRQHGHLPLR